MYKASIKHILMTILAKELLIQHIEIHAFNRFDTDLFLSDDEFNRLLYFVEMNFNIELSSQHISLHDRIPTEFKLIAPRYHTWIGETLEEASYTQFYTNGVAINVTLEGIRDVPLSYARHSQTIHSFKV